MNFSGLKELTIDGVGLVDLTINGVLAWKKEMSRIPSEYQEVEYVLKNFDYTYLDLGFTFDTACTFYIKAKKTNQWGYFFGAAEKSGALRCMITASANFNLYGSNGTRYISFASSDVVNGTEMDIKCEFRKGVLRVTDFVNGITKEGASQGEYTMANNLFLFAQNYNGNLRVSNTGIYMTSFSYYDKNDNLVCDLVPCYRKADGVVGMYDAARKIFLTPPAVNQANVKLEKGPDVL